MATLIACLHLPAAQAAANEINRTDGLAMGVAMDVSGATTPPQPMPH
jgi:hypothetical protein